MAERTPTDDIEVVGAERRRWGDWYQAMLRAQWWVALTTIAAAFMLLNLVFALAYEVVGGVEGAHSFADRFFFGVQTMATIGYGAMFPASLAAHVLTTCEAVTSILVVALATGLIFSKFSIVRARVRFAESAVIAPMNGVATLMFRIGNQRESRVIDAATRVVLSRRELTHEGVEMWRLYDLVLERDRAPALSRAWLIMHVMGPTSPLHGCTAQSLAEAEAELIISMTGIDETSGQTLHAQQTYDDQRLQWNVRYRDMLSRRPDGRYDLDLRRFDELTPCDGSSPPGAVTAGASAMLGPERGPE
jgi:inward rectifier potassium channel